MTTTSNEQARYTLLDQWARAAAGAGFPVPTRPHLVALAQTGDVTPMLQRVREVGMWRATIAWLLQQADAGTENALSKLPEHLVRPAAPPAVGAGAAGAGVGAAAGAGAAGAHPANGGTAPQAGGTVPQAAGTAPQAGGNDRFARLMAWHGEAVRAGVAEADGLREMHLRLVANSHVTTADEIRAVFPPIVGRFAEQIAGALSGRSAHGGPQTSGPGGPGGAPSHLGTTHAAGMPHAQGSAPGQGVPQGPAGGMHGAHASGGATPSPGTAFGGAAGAMGAHGGVPGMPPGASAPPAPSPAPNEPPQPPKPDLSVDPEGFAPYEFGAGDEDPVPIKIRRKPDGGIALSWPAQRPARSRRERRDAEADAQRTTASATTETGAQPGAQSGAQTDDVDATGDGDELVILDRLITSDEYAPYSPDSARLVIATRGTEAEDDLEFAHAARHYQVWRNAGTSIDDAKLSQPVKYASGELVSPVLDFDLREDEGRVIGQWRVLPGTTRVQVFRIPVQYAAGSSGDPQYRILHDDDNLGGFVDMTADRGRRYLYQVFAEAELDGVARLSAPTNQDLLVSAIHEPVRDLSFELHEDDEQALFDLSWTSPPGGQVVVYRTQQPPQPGIERQAIPVGALAQGGLSDDRKQSHPIVTDGDRAAMRQVPWPRGWTRAYFTTVVTLGDRAYVGNTVRGVRVPKVTNPKLVERVNRQVLTFEWPEGADIVLAYSSMPDVSSEVAMQGQPVEVSRNDYREQGGLEFPQGRLDAKGCDLHLVSVAFDGGSRVLAAPEVVHYPGLLRIWYRVLTSQLPDGRPLIRVQLLSEHDVDPAPPFVLVHNPDRLPLEVGDGRPVALVPEHSPNSSPQRRFVPSPLPSRGNGVSTWLVEPGLFMREVAPTGYLRLFVALPPEVLARVALLDPDVASLRLQAPQPQGGMPGGYVG